MVIVTLRLQRKPRGWPSGPRCNARSRGRVSTFQPRGFSQLGPMNDGSGKAGARLCREVHYLMAFPPPLEAKVYTWSMFQGLAAVWWVRLKAMDTCGYIRLRLPPLIIRSSPHWSMSLGIPTPTLRVGGAVSYAGNKWFCDDWHVSRMRFYG
jgi:hypothetical protein